MRKQRAVFLRLAGLVHRRRRAAELDDELESNLQMHIEDNLRAGMSPEEARYAALRKFGNVARVREDAWELWSFVWIEQLCQDVRFGLRMLAKNPGFTAVAIITLALGIGATTAIFTVVNGVLLRPLPYPHPEELVHVQSILNDYPVSPFSWSMDFAAYRAGSRTLRDVGAYMFTWFNLTGDGEAEHVTSGMASASFFSLLGTRPLVGRLFLPEEDRLGAPRVAILSETLWRSRYKADRSIVGKGITLDGDLYTVVGVLPDSFVIPDQRPVQYSLWVPLSLSPAGMPFKVVRIIGRLKSGISLASSQAELNGMSQATLKGRKDLRKAIVLSRWQDQITHASRLPLLLFLGAVGFLLLIACVNVANLTLSRAAARQKEMAVRLTVGAGKARLARQLLTESMLLGLVGGLLGLALAQWGKGLLISFISPDLPALEPIRLDYRVLGFTFGLSLITGLAFGFTPALQASGISLNEALKEAARGVSESRSGRFLRGLFVIVETTMAVVLLVGSGLLYRTFLRARGIDPGFSSEHVLSLAIDVSTAKYPKPEQQARYFEQVVASIQSMPGVASVGASTCPPAGGEHTTVVSSLIIEGQTEEMPIFYDSVSPGFFRTMHIPLLRGRDFDDGDRDGSPGAAIVNDAFVHRYFRGQSALGKKMDSWVHRKEMLTIVGVVGNVRLGWEREPDPEIYIPFRQGPQPFMSLLIHTPGDPMRLVPALRVRIAQIDKDQPLHDIATLDDIRAKSLTPRRVNMLLLGAFAALGLALASVGIYGVVSYSLSQRTHEIGIRMALGAERGQVRKVMVWQGFQPVLIGAGIGMAASLALTRFMQTLLFGVKPTDPLTFVAVASILVGVGLLATYLPTRRATMVDPMVALRYE